MLGRWWANVGSETLLLDLQVMMIRSNARGAWSTWLLTQVVVEKIDIERGFTLVAADFVLLGDLGPILISKKQFRTYAGELCREKKRLCRVIM